MVPYRLAEICGTASGIFGLVGSEIISRMGFLIHRPVLAGIPTTNQNR